ncbi:glycine zipper 2TM domain-containing protein [Novosphingobium lentum]|uniref:glycine zipper 2TM domain-containing protein n=1 Tax=Novosphingobium lentum TaxID=145287 RepID=UPI00082C3AE3|nr:glycine zipper 2TM domain-containing protein [Novosphingobium lentum]
MSRLSPVPSAAAAILALALALPAAPALAHDGHYQPSVLDQAGPGQWAAGGPAVNEDYERAREGWLADCRDRMGEGRHHRRGLIGALIGGTVGGVVGNRLADDNRVLGTVAGAAVGAVAGGVIDRTVSASHRRERSDYCEDYLDRYTGYGPGYRDQGYAPQPVVQQQTPCVETTTTTVEYVTTPGRWRTIKRRPPVRHKRVHDKRVYIGS